MIVRKSALVEHSAENMFDLIEAAEDYPAFLPWCASANILSRDDAIVAAEINVDFHGLRFQLTTRNPKRRPEFMAIVLERGPFRKFEGEWRLTPLASSACKIEFGLQYEFDSALMSRIAGTVFDRITNTLVDAYVARARDVYGMPAAPPH